MNRVSLEKLFALFAAGLALAVPAYPVARIFDVHQPLKDFDTRTASVAPSAQQVAEAQALGATVRWNAFGTPQSLIHYGGYLGTGYSAEAATAARDWLRDHAALFGLSTAGVDALELVEVNRFAGETGAAAVLFRQRFGGLAAAAGGLITVGVADGNIAYVSSSSAGEQPAPGAATLSATQAWLAAAANVGYHLLPVDLGALRQENGWTVFDVAGLSHAQRARLVAFPTPAAGVLPAFEALVLNVGGGLAHAYTVFVDAQTGAVLARHSRVNQFAAEEGLEASADKAQQTEVFQGAYQDAPAAQACGPLHGPYAVPANFRRIVVLATAAIVTNDVSIELYRAGDLVAAGDVATSPELLLYEPPGGVPAGSYYVRVCPFADPTVPATAPYSYAGTITWEDTPVPALLRVPSWRIFFAHPPLDHSSTDSRTLTCWTLTDADGTPVPGCAAELANLAARAPWDHELHLGLPTFTTLGNAASTASAWLSPLTPGEGYRPVSLTRSYDFPWQNTWYTSRCSPLALTPPGLTQANDLDAATANLFAMHNRMHDWAYLLGFTERNYNLQLNNFGLTALGKDGDPEIGDVQAGALTGGAPSYLGRDNANQISLNDGIPGVTNMYLWQPVAGAFYAPCVDGDFDMGVIGHEYTHAISNRMVGGPDGNLTGAQAGAMGEAWSDLVAVEYLNEYGFVPAAGEDAFALGTYVTGNGEKGIRNYNMSRNLAPPAVVAPAADLSKRNPLNYSNVGYDVIGVEVHSDAEIWVAANFDVRQALTTKYDALYPASDAALQRDCADGTVGVAACPGNRRWMQILFDSFLLMPASVSMLDARDALLAADVLRFGGANQPELWRAFAQRGMGKEASSAGTDDPEPVPGFASPLEPSVTYQFQILDKDTNLPVPAEIYVGHYEARAVPAADTVASTPLGDSIAFAPGVTHDLLVRANGYGHVRFPRFVGAGFAGTTETVTVKLAKNVASLYNGATITGDGINLTRLIDDTERTNWASLTAPAPGDKVTVDLAGGTQTITRVAVSAMLRPTDANDPDSASQNRFTALRQFEIWTCTAGNLLNPTCANGIPLGFTKIFTSAADAFPGTVPRPTSADLLLREFDVPDTTATHVQLRVVHTQCTGTAAFLGEQDADPLNATNCATASADGGRVRAAELQVFTTTSERPPVSPR